MKNFLLSLQSSLLAKALFWLACLVITALSLSPVEMLTAPIFDWWDKAQHASAFLALCCLGRFAYPKWPLRIFLGLLGFGVLIEVMQYFTGYRFAELSDFLADLTGVTLGAFVMCLAEKWLFKNMPKSAI